MLNENGLDMSAGILDALKNSQAVDNPIKALEHLKLVDTAKAGSKVSSQIEIAIAYLQLEMYISQFKSCASKLSSIVKVNQLSNCKGNTANKINLCIEQLNSSVDTLSTFATALSDSYEYIRKQFEQADSIASGIYPILTSFNSSNSNSGKSKISNDSQSEQSYPQNQENHYQKDQLLTDSWRSYKVVSPNGFTNYNGKGNCTWYADNRWSQMNPNNPLRFTAGSKNAKYWDDRIDRNYFNVDYANGDTIKSNTIAVSESNTYGHVAYVEDVREEMVYYTEDGEAYTRPHTWSKDSNGNWIGPRVQCCSISEFARKFSKIISSK